MKQLILIALCLCIGFLFANNIADTTNASLYTSPDMTMGFYDHYSKNLLNPTMTGRGNAGMAMNGGIETAFYNPASMLDNYTSFYMELMVKGNAEEFRESTIDNDNETTNLIFKNNYQSPFPWNFIGITFKPINKLHLGISLSVPNSIEYYSFSRTLPTEETLVREPTFLNYQYTLTTNYQVNDKLSLGLNTIMNIHSFDEFKNEGRMDRIIFNKSFFRFQPGILYQSDKFKFGASYLPKSEVEYEKQYIYYESTVPSIIRTGLFYGNKDNMFLVFDTDYTMYSQQADYLSDQLIIKGGIEKAFKSKKFKKGNYSLRTGFIYCPSIFEGYMKVPNYYIPTTGGTPSGSADFYFAIPRYEVIRNTEMLMLTMGLSVKLNTDAELNLSFATDLKENVNVDQFNSSVKFDLKAFEGLKKNKK